MAYLGRDLSQFSTVEKLDNITFTNSAGPYNLTKSSSSFVPASAQALLISVDGVIQASDSYTVSGSTITFGVSMPSTSTMDTIIHLGTGLITTPDDATVTTNKVVDNAITTAKILDSNITTAKIADDAVTNAKIANESITINGSAVSLGGSVTVGETKPTISSISPTVIDNTATAITITGTNFVSVPQVEAINSTGAITAADSITFTSATSITATFTLPTDGTYFIRIENNDGNAVRSSTALLTVSDAPAWQTSSGSLGSFDGTQAISTITLSATDATSFAVTTGSVTAGLTFTSGVGSATITGTQTAHTTASTDNFTVTATDAEGQTAARAFSISYSFGIPNSGQFN